VRVPDKSVLDSAILASTAKKLKAAIIFENDDYTVINKPSGLAVHAGSANDIGVIEALRSVYTGSRLELGHRIDKYTSGCLLLAKTRQGLRFFQDGIKSSGVVKVYRCIVAGKWPADKTTVDLPLLTTSNKAGHKTVVSYDGKKAVSLVEVISQNERYSLLEVKILTGRTHQIRVHLASSGYPIIGDGKYGWVRDNYVDLGANVRVMLHSYELSFPVGNRGKLLKFKAPVPGDFLECLRILENIAV
jgi:23S rRNA pseudouridine955/2504/2580 synthase